jgi:RND family efflux transporter MFP subunit
MAGPLTRKTLTLTTVQPAVIKAFEETPLHSKIAGYVEQVLVDIGDRVTQDQLLVKLSVPELSDEQKQKEALVAQAEADWRQAQAGQAAAEAAVKSAESQLAGAEAGIVRANGEHARWKAESDRIASLVATGVVTDKKGDETLNQLRAAEASQAEARAQVQSVQAIVAEAQAKATKSVADVAAAEARVRVAEAELAKAVTMLGYCEIRAPYEGIVTARNVDTRHYVQPAGGQAMPLVTVASHETVRVFASIPETEAQYVSIRKDDADPVIVTIQALSSRTIDGKVTRTSWSLDPVNRSLTVEVDLPNGDGQIRPGMYATMQLRLAEVKDVLSVPAAAVVRDGGEALLCVVENGKISRRSVKLGLRAGDEFEVREGLQGTEQVVLARAGGLKAGQAVEVTAPPAAPK